MSINNHKYLGYYIVATSRKGELPDSIDDRSDFYAVGDEGGSEDFENSTVYIYDGHSFTKDSGVVELRQIPEVPTEVIEFAEELRCYYSDVSVKFGLVSWYS